MFARACPTVFSKVTPGFGCVYGGSPFSLSVRSRVRRAGLGRVRGFSAD